MPSGYGLLPVKPPTMGPTPSPISRMITTSGSPRKMSVYTRAGHRSQRDREMPPTARAMPSTRPMTLARTADPSPASAQSEHNRRVWAGCRRPGGSGWPEDAAPYQFGEHDPGHRPGPLEACGTRTVGVAPVDRGELGLV